jgi:ATP-dependent Lon protease
VDHPGVLADLVASTLIIPGKDRQALLNACAVSDRLRTAIKIFRRTYGLAE